MNRLQSELHRLYLAPSPEGQTRSAVLELARPADWNAMAKVWRGVQADLALPAPAIAVSGVDAYQLWFSFGEPVQAALAQSLLEALRYRYLGDVAQARVSIMVDARISPPTQGSGGNWSAFVAPDLAPVFAEEPWLDTEPGVEGQADLLCRLSPIKSGEFKSALEQLGVGDTVVSLAAPAVAPAVAGMDPRSFLLKVMNDETVELGLRIEAAKALLGPHHEAPRRP